MSRRFGLVAALLLALAPWLTRFPPAHSAVAQTLGGPPSGQFTPQSMERGEIPSLRTRTAETVYDHGQYTTTISSDSLNYRDSTGTFQPIDDTLVPSTASGYAYQNRANRYTVRFPSDLGSGPIRIEAGGSWANISLAGVSGAGSVLGDTDTFPLPGGGIAYTAEPDAVKEAITLTGPASPATYTFALTTSSGLTPKQNPSGGIDFVTGSGQIPFAFAAPAMTDHAGVTSNAVRLTLTPATGGWTVSLAASATWLADPARSYPVVIDPTVILSATQSTYLVSDNSAGSSSLLYAGSYCNNSCSITALYHALLQFDLSGIPSTAQVTNADVALHLIQGSQEPLAFYQVAHSWTSAARWNTYDGTNPWTTPGGDSNPTAVSQTVTTGSSGVWYHWNPTQLVQGWVNRTIANDGMLLKEAPESYQSLTTPPQFAGPTYTTSADRPVLTVTWGPDLGARPWFAFDGAVNVVNGNLVLGSTDVSMGGIGIPLTVSRTYNGLSTGSSDFGNHWTMDSGADVGLQLLPQGSVVFTGPTGYQADFLVSPDGSFTHPPGVDATLVKNGDGTYTLTARGNGEKLTFSSGGVLTSDVTSTGNALTFSYAGNLLTSITDTLGQTTTFSYNSPVSPTLISQITDAAGRTYRYSYDATKDLTSFTTPSNETERYGYDASGRLTSITDPNGNLTTIGYDSSNRVSSITDALGQTTAYSYSPGAYSGGTTAVTDPNNHATTYTYDGQNRVTAVTDALNHTTKTVWNGDNHVVQGVAPSGATTTYTYDSTNENLTKVQLPNNVSETASYASSAFPYYPTTETDAQGNTSTITYNATTGTVASAKDASGASVSYTYYGNGSLASATDENGHRTSYTYANGNTGLPLQDTPPSPLGTTQYAFNSYNLESGVTDGNGKLTTFGYDRDGRLTGWGYADGTSVGYTRDADGNVTAMTDGSGTTSYTYNSLNELTSETLPDASTQTVACPVGAGGANVNVSVCYSYDAAGNLTSKTDTWGTVSYSYDPADQLTGVTDRQGHAYAIGYDQDGNETSIAFPNGVTEGMTHDGAGVLTKITGTKGSITLTSFSYSYLNPATNTETTLPYSVTDTANTTTSFTYDTSNELTQALKKSGGGTTLDTWTYGYDPAGNLTSKGVNGTTTTFTYNAANELTAASGGMTASYGYDGNGDRTSATVAGRTQQISVNAAGQITSITPSGGSAIPYTYTGIGEQTRTGAGTTTYQSDATGLIQQNDSNGDTTYTTLPDGTTLSENIPSGTYAGSYYYLADGAGSVAAVTNSTGGVSDIYSYDPLGNATSSGSVPNPFTFGGGMYDSQTGYYYTGSGYYDPATGQSFGCQDIGRYDPGEDNCSPEWADDENPACHGVCSHSLFRQNYDPDSGECIQNPDVCEDSGPGVSGWIGATISTIRSIVNRLHTDESGRFEPGETVREILRGKKGSIRQAPLPAGSPAWEDVLDMTWEQVQAYARSRVAGYQQIWKLLNDKRFNR